jgi:TetR/AcrR family transcriptional regulator
VAPLSSRTKILEVAEARFARSGFGGVGLRDVAVAAGLSKSTLFHHFSTKEALYVEVIGRVLERVAERVEPAFACGAPPAERLLRVSDALVDAFAEHPTTAPLLLRSLFEALPQLEVDAAQQEGAISVLQRLIGHFQDLVREGIAARAFREVSVPDTTQTIIGAAVFHFASGELGEQQFGDVSLFSAEAVARRRREQRSFFQRALLFDPAL